MNTGYKRKSPAQMVRERTYNERRMTRSQARENEHTDVPDTEKQRCSNESHLSDTCLYGLSFPCHAGGGIPAWPACATVQPQRTSADRGAPVQRACVAPSRACVPVSGPATSVCADVIMLTILKQLLLKFIRLNELCLNLRYIFITRENVSSDNCVINVLPKPMFFLISAA